MVFFCTSRSPLVAEKLFRIFRPPPRQALTKGKKIIASKLSCTFFSTKRAFSKIYSFSSRKSIYVIFIFFAKKTAFPVKKHQFPAKFPSCCPTRTVVLHRNRNFSFVLEKIQKIHTGIEAFFIKNFRFPFYFFRFLQKSPRPSLHISYNYASFFICIQFYSYKIPFFINHQTILLLRYFILYFLPQNHVHIRSRA